MILALKDYDACYAALKKDPAGGHRSGSRPEDAQLASELSTANDKLFGVFCSCQISRTIYNKDESLNS